MVRSLPSVTVALLWSAFITEAANAALLGVEGAEEAKPTSLLEEALDAARELDDASVQRHEATEAEEDGDGEEEEDFEDTEPCQEVGQPKPEKDGEDKDRIIKVPMTPPVGISTDLDSPAFSEKRKVASYFALLMLLLTNTIFFCYIVFGDSNAQSLDDKAEELKELEWSYVVIMKDMEKKVQALCDMQVDWSQHMFNAKKNDFVEFLLRLQANPERFGGAGSELLEPLRKLVKAWLLVFRECSIDPITSPMRPIEDAELDNCGSVPGLCDLVCKKLEATQIQFIELPPKAGSERRGSVWQVDQEVENQKAIRQEFMERAKKSREMCLCSWINAAELNPLYLTHTIERHQNKKSRRECFPLELKFFKVMRINFLTCKHLGLFILFVLMHLLALYLLVIRGHVGFLISLVCCALMWVVMWKFEVFDLAGHLRIMALEIHAQKDEMLAKGREIESLIARIERPSQLWIHRTRPVLDVMSGLCRKISVTKWPDGSSLKEFVETILAGVEALADGLGSTAEFSVVGDDLMKCVRLQLETTAAFISKNNARDVKPELLQRMQLPKMVVVRVLGCKNLPKGTWVDNYDPYVRLRCREDARWLRTSAKSNNPNPKWHTSTSSCEFRFLLHGPETELLVEVMDENSVGSDTFIGSVKIPLAEMEKGIWKSFTKKLPDAWQGDVSLECLFAADMEALVQLFPAPPIRHTRDDYSVDESDLEELEHKKPRASLKRASQQGL
eukprot:TRINITY_DN50303_c0_g1_i1.p1 TRINITY_DN50303_c0_g1~~TRINITY_DN50303_c0_g1_i1.p1  ORF type:complete len:731 (-),score=229.60 TRINITY_DN50303_c0_g1_i1:65-2257(-)